MGHQFHSWKDFYVNFSILLSAIKNYDSFAPEFTSECEQLFKRVNMSNIYIRTQFSVETFC